MTIISILLVTICLAQPGNPGGNGGGQGTGNGNGKCPNCVPIDSDIWLLVIAGSAMGGIILLSKSIKNKSQLPDS